MMQRFLSAALAALCAAFLLTHEEATADDPPNIIVVMADDLGYGDVGANGATRIATPHLDRMAGEGARLTSFYASANVCTPSRAGLLTGRYPIRLGLAKSVIFPRHTGGLDPEEITLAEALKEAGYATAMFGKWHLGNAAPYWPTSAGFDTFFGVPYSNDMNPFPLYRGEEVIEAEADQSTLTERYTAEAVKFIEEHREGPFFIYLPHTMPHIPLWVSERFEGRSSASLYGDVVETIDWGMGEIFSTLLRLGIDEQTLVLFTSDNGPWYEGSSGVHRDRKGSSWEGGQRVPFFARWPGTIPAGTVSGAIAMNIDLFPTLVGLAGGRIPEDRPIDGRDILDVLKGSERSPHEALYLFNEAQIAAVRAPRWKFVVQTYYKRGLPNFRNRNQFYHPGMLFDLEADPEELYNVAREHPEIARRMNELYERGRAELVEPNKDRDARNAE